VPPLQGNPGKSRFYQSGQPDGAAFYDVPEDPEVPTCPSASKAHVLGNTLDGILDDRKLHSVFSNHGTEIRSILKRNKLEDITKSVSEPRTPSTTCSSTSEASDPDSEKHFKGHGNTPSSTVSSKSTTQRRTSKLDELANESVPDHLSGLSVIGYVSNPYNSPQYIEWRKVQSRIQVAPDWVQGLDGVDGYSHLIIVWMMNLVGEKKKTHVPQGLYESVPKVGIFSCRCPQRPNPIATTTVRLIGIEGDGVLLVEGLDAVNGSPVLDIKPYDAKWDDLSVIRPGETVITPMWTNKLTY